jgi:hypothetical protein
MVIACGIAGIGFFGEGMPLFETLKQTIFPNRSTRRLLLSYFPELMDFDDAFEQLMCTVSNDELQIILAPFLRTATIQHLRQNQISPHIINFRTEYLHLKDSKSLNAYLKEHGRDGEWATDVQFMALADLLNCTAVVTTYRHFEFRGTFSLRQSTDPAALSINLLNDDNIHWYFYPGRPGLTIGDGNCFYNGFAQACREIITRERNLAPESMGTRNESTVANDTDHKMIRPIVNMQNKNEMNQFLGQFNQLKMEVKKLKLEAKHDPKFQKAAEIGDRLYRCLQKFYDVYCSAGDFEEFRYKCLYAIDVSRNILDPIWNVKQILTNLVLAILGLGVIYAVAVVYNKYQTGRYLFFPILAASWDRAAAARSSAGDISIS